MQLQPFLRVVLLLATLAVHWDTRLLSAEVSGEPGAAWSDSYRGRVLTERFRHQQAVARRLRESALSQNALLPEPTRALRPDLGDIAIIENTGGIVIERNVFDLQASSVTFSRVGAAYTVAPGPLRFSEEALANGSAITLADDDARQVFLPFPFPFFQATHQSVFVHSDGNVSFEEADTSTTARSFSRAVSGPPRIAPFFDDLDPSAIGAEVSTYATSEAFYVTWDEVPEFSLVGGGSGQTFQLTLRRGGNVEFHYRAITALDSVVGIMPGRLRGEPKAADLSMGFAEPVSSALAEIFSSSRDLDSLAVGLRFYQNHDDAYDYLVLFNGIGLPLGGSAFASASGVRNQVLGIGEVVPGLDAFDFGGEYGSERRLQTFINMGPLTNYPDDPTARIPSVGENNGLSVLTHEVGHRFLAYVTFLDPLFGVPSTRLLGRQLAHWSFFFNSRASVVEGNEIEDRGLASPRFRTIDAVSRFGDLDQYLMGLRTPGEVTPTFLVENPRNFSPGVRSPASAPNIGVQFDGSRTEVPVDAIVAAEGARVPEARVSQRDFRLAFLLMVPEGAEPSAATVNKLETYRTQWEDFFAEAVEQRARAETELVRLLHLSTWPAGGVVRGLPGRATVEIASPRGTDLDVLLTTDNGAITVPSVVTIPAGSLSASFPVSGNAAGVIRLTAHTNVPGYDLAASVVEVRDSPALLTLEVVSGSDQIGGRGTALPEPVVFRVIDQNQLPYSGVPIVVSASRDGVVSPERAVTRSFGRLEAAWTLASSASLNTLTAAIEGVPGSQVTIEALSVGPPPAFAAAGVVNAASFNLGAAAAHAAIAPGGLISIFGEGLALETAQAQSLPLPLLLGGVRVNLNGVPAPLLFVSPRQINLQVPFEVAGPSAQVILETLAGTTPSVTLPLAGTQPGIFVDFTTGLGAIVNVDDKTPVWARRARPGTFVQIFCTGLGAVEPKGLTGAAAPALPVSETLLPVRVEVGGREAVVSFAGLAPRFAGLYQVNALLPADLPPGRHMLSLEIDGRQSNEVPIQVD